MNTAFVLITTSAGQAKQVAMQLRGLHGVRLAHAVTGQYDVIAFVEADGVPELGSLVTEQIQQVPGVQRTVTCLTIETEEELHRRKIAV